MIKPAIYKFQPITRGDTFGCISMSGTTLSVEPLRFKIGIDLTDFTIRAQGKLCMGSNQSAIDLTSESAQDIEITDPVAGEFQIKPFRFDVAPGEYLFDMEFTKANVGRFTFFKFTIPVVNDITR